MRESHSKASQLSKLELFEQASHSEIMAAINNDRRRYGSVASFLHSDRMVPSGRDTRSIMLTYPDLNGNDKHSFDDEDHDYYLTVAREIVAWKMFVRDTGRTQETL